MKIEDAWIKCARKMMNSSKAFRTSYTDQIKRSTPMLCSLDGGIFI